MATTTNYGWETPDDTDLVKDGAAAIRTLGNSVDTTTKNLNPETTLGDIAYRSATANVNTRLALGTANQVLRVNSGGTAPEWAAPASAAGLVCIKAETAFTAVSSVTVDTVFSATYTNYLLSVRYTTSTTNNVNLQLRVGGATAATNYNSQFFAGVNASADVARLTGQTSLQLARSTNGSFVGYVTAQISGPFLASATLFAAQVASADAAYTAPVSGQHIHNHSDATSYDGFIMSVSTGTFTGSYILYGYSKAV